MIRRFNYTGRKKILREDVPFALTGAKPVWGFNVDLGKLTTYDLPHDARVYVEAYEQASYMRFDFGMVSAISTPSADARLLTEFEGSDGVRFRVKVVDASPEAKLLAEADGILPLSPEEAEQNKLPLLPVRHHNLHQEIWRIDFEDGTQNRPTLLISEQIPDRIAFVRSPAFTAMAWPALFREILTRILLIEKHYEVDDPDDWRSMWLLFARTFVPGSSVPKDADTANDWINDIITAFCEKNALLAKLKEYEEEIANAVSA
jgi:hypothetical protein